MSWPFIIIRHTGGINDTPDAFAQLMESHRRHRGACDEFWFCADRGRKKPEVGVGSRPPLPSAPCAAEGHRGDRGDGELEQLGDDFRAALP